MAIVLYWYGWYFTWKEDKVFHYIKKRLKTNKQKKLLLVEFKQPKRTNIFSNNWQ
jgi:hypothetical protein